MRNKSTYFLRPQEPEDEYMGLFSYAEDRAISFAVCSDGSIKELTPNYFPQQMINNFQVHFQTIALRTT
jgi:hypothetical protein